ncbi:MAG TPA: DUF3224 domain-containing protein [Caldilineaceae bacterium]|nr:DUF3224 domain-containing protein [Caldilineaceae bacterium]
MQEAKRMQAKGTFTTTSWDEQIYDERGAGAKLSRGHMTNQFQGDLEGEGKLEALMSYTNATTADFVGLERFTGRLAGRSGSFVLEEIGRFVMDQGAGRSSWRVLPGSATGGVQGVCGEDGYEWNPQRGWGITPFTRVLRP